MALRFSKMHGLGNDFVVVDCRAAPLALGADAIRRLADRHTGVGFDQLLTIGPARDGSSAFAYGIWNTDGSRAGQCGNGVRCVARWLERAGALAAGRARLQGPSGAVAVELLADGTVRVDMGAPRFEPAAIPLQLPGVEAATDRYAIDTPGGVVEVGAVSMGNPHALVEVDAIEAAAVATLGPLLEHSPAFPHGCNVGFAQVLAPDAISLRVWERGVGETRACGSGACAAVAVLRRRAKLAPGVRVALPGGELAIHWDGPGQPVWMAGPATFVFEGEWHDTGTGKDKA